MTDVPQAASPTVRRLVLGVLLLVVLGGALWMASSALVRARVDTAVTAVADGEPGCVTVARFTGPDDVARTVDLRTYKGSCRRDADPGDDVTVYYDASHPARVAATQAWWWPATGTAFLLAVSALIVVGLARTRR